MDKYVSLSANNIPQDEAFSKPWYILNTGSRPFVILADLGEEFQVQYVASLDGACGVTYWPKERVAPYNKEIPKDVMEMMKMNRTVYQYNNGGVIFDCYLVGTSSKGKKIIEFLNRKSGLATFAELPNTVSLTPKPIPKVIKCAVNGQVKNLYFTLPKDVKTEIKPGMWLLRNEGGGAMQVLEVDVEKTDPGIFDLYKDMPEFRGVRLVTKDL